MKHATLLLASLAASAAGLAAAHEPQPSPAQAEEARIPFPRLGGVRNFRTVGDDVVYLQDRHRNWYRATLAGACLGLPMALRIGIDSRYGDALDSNSTLIVDGERCPIHSLVRSEEPPRRRPRR
jgi:hypothetical protein